jgi:hypothetical protein
MSKVLVHSNEFSYTIPFLFSQLFGTFLELLSYLTRFKQLNYLVSFLFSTFSNEIFWYFFCHFHLYFRLWRKNKASFLPSTQRFLLRNCFLSIVSTLWGFRKRRVGNHFTTQMPPLGPQNNLYYDHCYLKVGFKRNEFLILLPFYQGKKIIVCIANLS